MFNFDYVIEQDIKQHNPNWHKFLTFLIEC